MGGTLVVMGCTLAPEIFMPEKNLKITSARVPPITTNIFGVFQKMNIFGGMKIL